jgi:hypothetical protein
MLGRQCHKQRLLCWATTQCTKCAKALLGEPKVESREQRGIASQKDKIERKDSGKARAFMLFDEGKRPSDSELKATKLKPQILYRYYQEWKHLSAN